MARSQTPTDVEPTESRIRGASLDVVARTPSEFRAATSHAEALGLKLDATGVTGRFGWELHPRAGFDAWHPQHWSEFAVEPGISWFTVIPEDGDPFRVRAVTPGHNDAERPGFVLSFVPEEVRR